MNNGFIPIHSIMPEKFGLLDLTHYRDTVHQNETLYSKLRKNGEGLCNHLKQYAAKPAFIDLGKQTYQFWKRVERDNE